MSWLKIDSTEYADAIDTLQRYDLVEGVHYKSYRPGWNSIVTGKQHTAMPFYLLLFMTKSSETMARMVL